MNGTLSSMVAWFWQAATPPELRFAFSQLLELFQGQSSKLEDISELFWGSLHGIAELTRTKRFPRSRQKEHGRALVELTTPRTGIANLASCSYCQRPISKRIPAARKAYCNSYVPNRSTKEVLGYPWARQFRELLMG
jgi:hypothetical protein